MKNDANENITAYDLRWKLKFWIIFNDIIAEKRLILFIHGKKGNISIAFTALQNFIFPKVIRINYNHYENFQSSDMKFK